MIISDYIICTNHSDRPGINATICKTNISLLLPVSALNTTAHK